MHWIQLNFAIKAMHSVDYQYYKQFTIHKLVTWKKPQWNIQATAYADAVFIALDEEVILTGPSVLLQFRQLISTQQPQILHEVTTLS